jgi:hypothetical protein
MSATAPVTETSIYELPIMESKTQSVDDEVLGTLKWDEQLNWYVGEVQLTPKKQIRVNIDVGTDGAGLIAAIERARQAYKRIQAQEYKLRLAATDALLDLHNDTWNDGDKIGPEIFMGRMDLETISLYADGTAELYYNDGDLFWGHTILVSVDEQGGFEDASIAG